MKDKSIKIKRTQKSQRNYPRLSAKIKGMDKGVHFVSMITVKILHSVKYDSDTEQVKDCMIK